MSGTIVLLVEPSGIPLCDDEDLLLNQPFITENTYRAANLLQAGGAVEDNALVHFVAGERIVLSNGFRTGSGSQFAAYIEDCQLADPALPSPTLPESASSARINNKISLDLYPNPAQDVIHLNVGLDHSATVRLLLTDLHGRTVWSRSQNLEAGAHQQRIQLNDLQAGSYQVHLLTETETLVRRLVIVR